MATLQSEKMLCTKEGKQFKCQVDHCSRSFTSWQGWQYHFLNKHTNIRNPSLDESVEEIFPLAPSAAKSEPTSPDSIYGDALSSSSKESTPERDFVLGKRSAINTWKDEEPSPKNQRNSWTRNSSVCDICGKRLSSSSNLKVHKNTLHFGQRWRCRICGRTCTSKESVLKTCKKTHQGEDVEFVKPDALQEISTPLSTGEIHLGDELETLECIQSIVSLSKSTVNIKEQPLEKNEEGSGTDSEPEYSGESHESDHWCEEETPDPSGRKPTCHICGKGFASNSSLKVHKNILHFGKRWRCRICGRVCTKKQNVQATCRRHHPGEDIEVISVTEADYPEDVVMEISADELNTEPVILESPVPWQKDLKMTSPKA